MHSQAFVLICIKPFIITALCVIVSTSYTNHSQYMRIHTTMTNFGTKTQPNCSSSIKQFMLFSNLKLNPGVILNLKIYVKSQQNLLTKLPDDTECWMIVKSP